MIIVELFCPVLCDEDFSPVTAKQTNYSEINRSFLTADSTTFSATQTVSAAFDRCDQEKQNQICHDECLCHVTAITEVPFSIPKPSSMSNERIASIFKEPILSSLPPPDRPPNIS